MTTILSEGQWVRSVVEKQFPNREIAKLTPSHVGLMHRNFVIEFSDGGKIFYRGQNTIALPQQQKDIYFGDALSLKREIIVMEQLRAIAIPVPDVLAFAEDGQGPYALLSFLEGVSFHEYLRLQGHRLPVFFESLRHIGQTLARTRSLTFREFGSIQPDGIGGARPTFAERWTDVLERHSANPNIRAQFSEDEWASVQHFISDTLAEVRTRPQQGAQLVIYDLHAKNFFVQSKGDHAGELCGVFDVEFAQAAPASLEWHFMSLQLFALYGSTWFAEAKAAFLQGYAAGGGDTTEDPVLERAYVINYALSVVGFYYGFHDGVRDTWSALLKQWTLDIVRGSYDPGFPANLTRSVHLVPLID